MNILVCVKQVPDTTEIRIDPETNRLIREGVPSIVNTFDTFALELANKIKDENETASITVICMGPMQASNALRECLSSGADHAVLLTDKKFGGSDTLATSYILSGAIKALEKKEKFDLVLCGIQAIDGDTGQVGPELAEHLNLPQATYVTEIEEVSKDKITVKKETDIGYERLELELPAVLAVTKTPYSLRYPSIMSKLAAQRANIQLLTAEDLQLDETKLGLKGSPTKVKRTFVPSISKETQKIDGESPQHIANQLLDIIKILQV